MSLSRFHPIVSRWFSETLGEPTRAQAQGWAAIRHRRHTLIAAPTGSGKTLAAFLSALDDLVQDGLAGPLPDEVRVVYVSPLKALSADIHKNLAEPRRGIRRLAEEQGLEPPHITAAVRTGDTTQAERAAMLRTPPHILVTTPESLYLLLTAERSRGILGAERTSRCRSSACNRWPSGRCCGSASRPHRSRSKRSPAFSLDLGLRIADCGLRIRGPQCQIRNPKSENR